MMSGLSGRESRIEEIMELARKGMTDKEIAVRLGVSPTTVATYWKRVRGRVGARSRAAAIAHHDALRISELKATLDALPMAVAVAADGAFAVMNERATRMLKGVEARKVKGAGRVVVADTECNLSQIPWFNGVATLIVSAS